MIENILSEISYGPHIGQALLLGSLLTSILTLLVPLEGKAFKRLYLLQFGFLITAFGWLIQAHLNSDFSLLNVFQHSHTQKPWLYKFAGTWGNHEGSMLLWTALLALVGWLAFQESHDRRPLVIFSLFNFSFVLFLLMTCDPFTPLLEIPQEGKDLNPLLQDPLLAIHPPFLYLGYVCTAVLFTMALLKMDNIIQWRKWCLISWTSLTIGLGLGSFWAYYELGWGGWWFWDPVENIALIPWLLLTALLHNLSLLEKEILPNSSARWLSYFIFASCLGGTFVVRSGLLTSVHSFAIDPERGLFLGLLTGFILLPAFYVLIKSRSPSFVTPPYTLNLVSFMRLGIGLLIVGASIVAFGTIYPLILEALNHAITVGAPYFNTTFVPLMLPLIVLMALQPWIKNGGGRLMAEGLTTFLISGIITLICGFYGVITAGLNLMILLLSLWLLLSTLLYLIKEITLKKIAMGLAHIGLAVTILGMVLSVSLQQETLIALKQGEFTSFAGRTFTLTQMEPSRGPNYMAQRALLLTNEGHLLAPEKRLYWTQGIIHNETAIRSTWFDHLYVALGERYDNDAWSFHLYHKPWINLIWLGVILMALGGFLGLCRRRFSWIILLICMGGNIGSSPALALDYHEQLSVHVLESRAKDLGNKLICPTCAGQTLNDSAAEEAQLLREIIRQQLLKGYSDQQITDWFVARYGERILLTPPLTSTTLLLWGGPWMLLLILIGILVIRIRRNDHEMI